MRLFRRRDDGQQKDHYTFAKGSCSPCQSGGLRKCPIKKSHMHVTDPVVHVTVWWI